jgi:hypothetical protein
MLRVASRAVVVCASVIFAMGCAGGDPETSGGALAEEPLVDSSPFPRDLDRMLAHPEHCSAVDLDHVWTVEHDVRVGRGRFVHVVERFTLRGWLSWPHRGVLMLPGTIVRGDFYEVDVDGYRFQSELAEHGMFAFTVDYEGSGDSSYPEDGSTVTHSFLVDESRTVLTAMRALRAIPRMDIVGESNGGAIAAELCSDGGRTRSCVMSSMIYAEGTPFFNAVFLDPGFLAFIGSQPNNYLDVTPALYFNIAARSSPDVTGWILTHEPGLYATAPLLVPITLPWFDPTHARVPGLIIQGTEDDIATQVDNDALALAYGSAHHAGGHATVARIAHAGHVPRVEPSPVHDEYGSLVLDFLDPPH